jgi:probable rRNA maturation factor
MSRAKLKSSDAIEITNLSKVKRIKIKNIRKVLSLVFSSLGIPYAQASILLCDNNFIRKLNRKFFNESGVTDVISFPLKDAINPQYLGEVVICVEEAKNSSKLYGNTWQEELVLYLIHGILHILGFDDIKAKDRLKMQAKQEKILSKLLQGHKKIVSGISA